MTEGQQSVYERALGQRFTRLQPELQAYFSLSVGGGMSGTGSGTFDVAGCPLRWLRPVMRLAAAENIFCGDFGHSVPFSIENHAHLDPFGRHTLTAVRRMVFPGAVRAVEDSTVFDSAQGLLGYAGRHRRLVTSVDLDVTSDGHMRIRSSGARPLAGPLRPALPSAVNADAYTEQWWDNSSARFRIQTKIIQPQLGSLFVYAGSFDYHLISTEPTLPARMRPLSWKKR